MKYNDLEVEITDAVEEETEIHNRSKAMRTVIR